MTSRESMKVPDSGSRPPTFWILDSGFHTIVDSGFNTIVDSGFQTIVDSGFQSLDSGFQQQKLAGFRIPDSLTWGENGIWNSCRLAKYQKPKILFRFPKYHSFRCEVHINLPPNMTCKLSFSKRAHKIPYSFYVIFPQNRPVCMHTFIFRTCTFVSFSINTHPLPSVCEVQCSGYKVPIFNHGAASNRSSKVHSRYLVLFFCLSARASSVRAEL